MRCPPVIVCFEVVYGYENGRRTCADRDPLLIIRPNGDQIREGLTYDERTPRGTLGFEDLEGFAGAQEGSDEVHVDDALEGLEGDVLDGHLRRIYSSVLEDGLLLLSWISTFSTRTDIEYKIQAAWNDEYTRG